MGEATRCLVADKIKIIQKPNVFENLGRFSGGLCVARCWMPIVSESVFDFLGWKVFPLGKNENKWHKSASYFPQRNSNVDWV